MIERVGAVKMKGDPVTLIGPDVKVGDKAPDFSCLDTDFNNVTLSDTRYKVRLIASVPSLDTAVCNKESVRINDEAERLGDKRAVFIVVSMDLPFAQRRFMEDEEALNLRLLSDYKYAAFGQAYGVLMRETRLLTRAVFVVDDKGFVRHAEYVRDNSEFPDLDAAFAAVRRLLAGAETAAA